MLISVGNHLLRHGDLQGIEEFAHPPVDLVFTDPPWGDAKIRQWQGAGGAPESALSPDVFISTMFDIIVRSCKPAAMVWIEYPDRSRDAIYAQAARVGLHVLAVANPSYGRPLKPFAMFVMSPQPRELPAGYVEAVSATKGGLPTVSAAVAIPPATTSGRIIPA